MLPAATASSFRVAYKLWYWYCIVYSEFIKQQTVKYLKPIIKTHFFSGVDGRVDIGEKLHSNRIASACLDAFLLTHIAHYLNQ